MKTKKDFPKFHSIDCLKNFYERNSDGYFFKPSTMRFFRSRLTSQFEQVNKTTYLFITTEKAGFNDFRRVATVRIAKLRRDRKKYSGFSLSINTLEGGYQLTMHKAKNILNNGGVK